MSTLSNQTVSMMYTPFTPSQVRIKLKAQVEHFPTPSLLTKRFVTFPQVVVRIDDERFQLTQRKSYLNPWEPVFSGGVLDAENQGSLIVGEWKASKVLTQGTMAYRAIVGWSVLGLMYLATLVNQPLGFNYFAIESMAVLGVQLLTSVVLIELFRKRYQSLAEGERDFLMTFLQESLQAHPMPPPPVNPDPAVSEKMDQDQRLAA